MHRQDRSALALRSAVHVAMFTTPTVGPRAVAAPAPGASPLQGILVALLASAVALRQLDWWKLLERAGHLPTRRGQLLVHVTAIGLTFTGADAAEEVAEEEESPLACAVGHALLRVALEAALFDALLTFALACGLSDGDNHDHQNDLLAYLADALVGGWGEALVHALGCVLFIAACEIARTLTLPVVVATPASRSTRSVEHYVGATLVSPSVLAARRRARQVAPLQIATESGGLPRHGGPGATREQGEDQRNVQLPHEAIEARRVGGVSG